MNNKFVYTPGPSYVRENVRLKRAEATTNPDIDVEFVELYKNTCEKTGKVIGTKNSVYILSGEGILGLEAACASLTEQGDRVLVIDNGIFGRGFADFVTMYGGEVTYFSSDYTKKVDTNELSKFLEKDHNFKYATFVHCDTPTGMLNDIKGISKLLSKYNIISVVDSVAAMGGSELKVDEWDIDVILGGSQKAFSAPPGLTIVGLSEKAKNAIENRKTKVAGFYCDLNIWKSYYEEKWFPYTMPISDIIAFDRAIDNILDEGIKNVVTRHQKIADATRKAITEYGLELFVKDGFADTVTAVKIPESIGALNLTAHILKKYNSIMSTSLKPYDNQILRIGHMGENATALRTVYALNIIDNALKDLGFDVKGELVALFNKYLK